MFGSDGDDRGGVGGRVQDVALDKTPYTKKSEVTAPVFLIVLLLTPTKRPTGHCNDWCKSSSFSQIEPVNLRWSHCDVVGFGACSSRLGPTRA